MYLKEPSANSETVTLAMCAASMGNYQQLDVLLNAGMEIIAESHRHWNRHRGLKLTGEDVCNWETTQQSSWQAPV